jgi:FkbM family methyltransferase
MRKIFINLGANIGQDILSFKEKQGENFYSWEIFAFEPYPPAAYFFEKNITDHNVKLIKKAASVKDEIRNFYLGKTHISGSLRSDKTIEMLTPHNIPNKYRKKIKVLAVDISKWIKENVSETDYVIMYVDIEGSEYDILNKMISEKTIYLLDELHVEWHGIANQLFKISTEEHKRLKSEIKNIFGEKYFKIRP